MIPTSKPVLPNKELIKAAIDDIWSTNKLSGYGKYGQMFEEKAKQFTGARHTVAVSSGDTALKLAIAAMRMTDQKVVIPTFTFNSTYMAADWNNCEIQLVDIDKETLLVPLENIEAWARAGIRNFILVNTFGNLYNIRELDYLTSRYELNILFDSAHSFGSEYWDGRSGNLGYTECFSFSPTKLITSGEGGMICTNSTDIYEELQKRRNYGMLGDYNSTVRGANGKISEINAAIGAYSIDMLPGLVDKKNEIVDKLKYFLQTQSPCWTYGFQKLSPGVYSTFKDFIIFRIPWKMEEKLAAAGIQTKKYFLPLHRQLYCGSCSHFPNADMVYNDSLCIPSHTSLTDDEIKLIVDTLCILS